MDGQTEITQLNGIKYVRVNDESATNCVVKTTTTKGLFLKGFSTRKWKYFTQQGFSDPSNTVTD